MTPTSNPYWYKLIKLLKAKGVITTGLTIPYIYGAYKILEMPFSDIDELLAHIYYSRIDKYPVIQKCPVIEQHVVMVEDKVTCNKLYKKDIRFENTDNKNILFISTNTSLGKTLDKVISNLTILYSTPIQRGEFSWNNKLKEWKQFDGAETEMIKSILNRTALS